MSRYAKLIITRKFLVHTDTNIRIQQSKKKSLHHFNSANQAHTKNKLTPKLTSFHLIYLTSPQTPRPCHQLQPIPPPYSLMTVLANPFSNGKDKRSDSVVLSRLPPEFPYIDWPLLDCRKVGDGKPSDGLDLVLRA